MVGVIGLIGQQITGTGQTRTQHDRPLDVGGLAGGEIERQRTAMLIAYGVILGVAASFREANGLSRGTPFPPPAQRWTLM